MMAQLSNAGVICPVSVNPVSVNPVSVNPVSVHPVSIRPVLIRSAVVLTTIIFVLCNAQEAHAEKGWVLAQNSNFTGKVTTYVTPNAVKIVNPRTGVNILTRAPDWKVWIFSAGTKTVFMTKAEKFHGVFAQAASKFFEDNFEGLTVVGKENEKYLGLKSRKLVLDGQSGPPEQRNMFIVSARYWVTDEFGLPPQINKLMQTYFRLPHTSGFPLEIDDTTWHSPHRVEFETKSITRQQIDGSVFEPPKNYRQSAQELDVMLGSSKEETVRDVLDGLDGYSMVKTGGPASDRPKNDRLKSDKPKADKPKSDKPNLGESKSVRTKSP